MSILKKCLVLSLLVFQISFGQDSNIVISSPHTGWIKDLAFSSDGSMLASCAGDQDDVIILWDVKTRTKKDSLQTREANNLSFSTNGKFLAAGGYGMNPILLWDIIAGEKVELETEWGWVHSSVFSPDSRFLASGLRLPGESVSHTIQLHSTESGKIINKIPGEISVVTSMDFSPTDSILATSGIFNDSKLVELWNPWNGELLKTLNKGGTVRFSADGNWLIVSSKEGGFNIYKMPEIKLAYSSDYTGIPVGFSNNGEVVSFDSTEKKAVFYDLAEMKITRSMLINDGNIYDYDPGNNYFAADNLTMGQFNLLDANNGSKLYTFKTQYEYIYIPGRDVEADLPTEHDGHIRNLTFSPDGSMIVSCAGVHDIDVLFWDVESGRVKKSFRSYSNISKLTFSKNGKFLAMGGSGLYPIELLDMMNWKGKKIESPSGGINSIAFTSDSKYIAFFLDISYIGPNIIQLHNTESGILINSFLGKISEAFSMDFSPTDSILATSGKFENRNIVELWNPWTGELLKTLNIGGTVRFSPDGKMLIVSSQENGFNIYRTTPDIEIIYSSAYSGRLVGFTNRGEAVTYNDDTKKATFFNLSKKKISRTRDIDLYYTCAYDPVNNYWAKSSDAGNYTLYDGSNGDILYKSVHRAIKIAPKEYARYELTDEIKSHRLNIRVVETAKLMDYIVTVTDLNTNDTLHVFTGWFHFYETDHTFTLEDKNYDGYKDLKVLMNISANGRYENYEYWIYNPATNEFKFVESD